MNFEITQQGEVVINSLTVVRDHPAMKLILGDLRSKYANVGMYSSFESQPHQEELSIWLEANERTLNVNADVAPDTPTLLVCTLSNPSDHHWTQMAEIARYTLTWCLWRWYKRDEIPGDLQEWTPPEVPNVIRKRNEEDLPLEVL